MSTHVHEIESMGIFNLSTTADGQNITRIIAKQLISEVRINGDEQPDAIPRTFTSNKRHSGVSAQDLSERWFIGLAQAHETIKVTTNQNCPRSEVLPPNCRYRVDRVFEKPLLRGDFYTDTKDGRCKSLN